MRRVPTITLRSTYPDDAVWTDDGMDIVVPPGRVISTALSRALNAREVTATLPEQHEHPGHWDLTIWERRGRFAMLRRSASSVSSLRNAFESDGYFSDVQYSLQK